MLAGTHTLVLGGSTAHPSGCFCCLMLPSLPLLVLKADILGSL